MALHIQFGALFMWFIQNMQIICNLKLYYTPFLLQVEQFKTGKTVKLNDPALLIAQHKKQWAVVNMLRHKKNHSSIIQTWTRTKWHQTGPNQVITNSHDLSLAFSDLMIRRIFSIVFNLYFKYLHPHECNNKVNGEVKCSWH